VISEIHVDFSYFSILKYHVNIIIYIYGSIWCVWGGCGGSFILFPDTKICRNPYGATRLAWGVLGVAMIFWDLVATWRTQTTWTWGGALDWGNPPFLTRENGPGLSRTLENLSKSWQAGKTWQLWQLGSGSNARAMPF